MDELEKVRQEIAALNKKAEELLLKKKPEVIEDIKTKIVAYHITAKELGLGEHRQSSTAGSTIPIKYRHGDKTWTGRGRQPQFIVDYIAGGGTLEELKV